MKKKDDNVRPPGRPSQPVDWKDLRRGAPLLTRIYLPDEAVEWIRARAARNDRSTTREIVRGIEQYIDKEAGQPGSTLPRPEPSPRTLHEFVSAKLPVELIERLDIASGDIANRKIYLTHAVMWWLRQKGK